MSGAGSFSGLEAPRGPSSDADLHATAVALAILVASSAVDFLTHALLGRWLGERAYGDYGVALSLTLLLGYVACVGGDESVPRFVPAYRAQGRLDYVVGFLRSQVAVVVLAGTFLLLGGLVALKILPGAHLPHPVKFGFFMVPVVALSEVLFVTLNSLGRTVAAALTHQVAWPLIALGACGAFVMMRDHLSSNYAMLAFAIGALVTLPVYAWLLRDTLPREA